MRNEAVAEILRRGVKFNIESAYRALDPYGLGFISTYQLMRFIEDNGYSLTEVELNILLDRYDRDRDYRISSQEFTFELTPWDNSEEDDDLERCIET